MTASLFVEKTLNNFWATLKEIFDAVRRKPMLVYGIGCLLLTVLSFFFTYYLRVIYSPAWLGQVKGTLVISAAFIILWTAFSLASKFRNNNMPLFMSLLLFAGRKHPFPAQLYNGTGAVGL